MMKLGDMPFYVIIIWVLFFIFITLKLTGAINWSWWIITAPMWLSTLIIPTVTVIYKALTGEL